MRIEFRGYAGDCTISGHIDPAASRLSDSLNTSEDLIVHDALLHSLEDGRAVLAGEVSIRRDDLFAVETAAPRGDERRRVRTVRHPVRVQAGPYVIFGELHALPGVAPLRSMLARRTMVPLTNCHILFRSSGRSEVHAAGLLILNGRLIDSAEPTTADRLEGHLAAEAELLSFDAPHEGKDATPA